MSIKPSIRIISLFQPLDYKLCNAVMIIITTSFERCTRPLDLFIGYFIKHWLYIICTLALRYVTIQGIFYN
jgi:hypothetical protein